jgi:hypothetical protein
MAHRPADPWSLAALSISEALALALAEAGVLTKDEVCRAIDDAAAAHRDAARWSVDAGVHRQAAWLSDRVRSSIDAACVARTPPTRHARGAIRTRRRHD